MIKRITPEKVRCGLGQCPEVYEAPDGSVIIVGNDLTFQEAQAFGVPLGKNERGIVVPREFYEALPGEGGGN